MPSTNATVKMGTMIALLKRLRPQRSVLIRGDHGIGKSAVARQLARHFGLRLIDFRLGQRTPGDVIGMPDLSDGTTVFRPPAELLAATREPCLVLFDELNRACDEVLQSVFQVCLDRRLPDGTPLHPETRVYAAVNAAAVYNVGRLDPALVDRFAVFDLAADSEAWVPWARRPKDHPDEGGGILDAIVDFIVAHPDLLFPSAKAEPESVQPSPRSWEFLSDDLRAAALDGSPADPLYFAMCVATLGVEVASVYQKFAKDTDDRVTGKDVLDQYTANPTGEKADSVITWRDKQGKDCSRTETWDLGRLQAKVRRLTVDRLTQLVDELGREVRAFKAPGTQEQAENIRRFALDLPPEVRVSLWGAFTLDGVEDLEVAKWWHPSIAEPIVTGAFGVPMGEDGVGVPPNIPTALKDKDGAAATA